MNGLDTSPSLVFLTKIFSTISRKSFKMDLEEVKNAVTPNFSLYKLSLWKTAWLLKNSFWTEVSEGCRNNPFTCVPSPIIDDLISCVLNLTTSGSLQVTDLYHLLTSGRVEHFKLDDILLSSEEFISILMALSVACQNLRCFTLRNVFFSDHYASLHKTKGYMKKAALECVLSISPLLEAVESCVLFDLKALRNCERLKVLKLNFVSKTPLCDFLEEMEGVYWPHTTLSVMEVFEDIRNPVPYLEIVPVIKYCQALTHINTDISRCLEYLHSDELYKGTLSKQYKLQKCYLGDIHLPAGSASSTSVHIATLTCPQLKEIDILVGDNDAIYALSDFNNLTSLLIQWELTDGGDFQLGVQLMLNKAGKNLKNLHIINFYNVDFAALASMCPKVEDLKLEFISEFRGHEVAPEGLKFLKTLHVENIESQYGCCANTLSLLLGHCTNLTLLRLHCASSLNDAVLSKILQTNRLDKVKEAVLFNTSLTEEGVRNLALNLKQLEFLHFGSSQILFDDAAMIVHEINPSVIISDDIE